MKIEYMIPTTIQGEGHWVGTPATLVRLYGCPVGCPWCDTGYAANSMIDKSYIEKTEQEIADECVENFVFVTGGEPMWRKEITGLCSLLLKHGHFVQIETSGAFWQPLSDKVWVTLSPKRHVTKFDVDARWWKRANEVKIVVCDGTEGERYPELEKFKGVICFQPEYGKREWTTPLCLQLARKYGGKISTQVHKMIGLP